MTVKKGMVTTMEHREANQAEELLSYIAALQTFGERIMRYCDELEQGVRICRRYMFDEASQNAIKKGEQLAKDLRACVDPARQELDLLYESLPASVEKARRHRLTAELNK